jgi:NADH-quinone oxidoreductase subunit J
MNEQVVLQIVFMILMVITLGTAYVVVTSRNLFHAALALMGSFFGVAGFYAMLAMGFLAAAQLLVYIGAISILIIFAIMMTRRMMQTRETPYNSQWLFGAVTGLAVFLLFGLVIVQTWGVTDVSFIQASEAELNNKVIEMGQALVSADQFVLPFELASVLLLAALIGSIVVALPESKS